MMDKMSYYINIFDITYDNSYLSMINCTYIISKECIVYKSIILSKIIYYQ